MMKMKRIGNKGVSLIEILVVVAILAVLGSVAIAGVRLLTNRPVDECARKFQIALEGIRNTTMGKFSGGLEFTADANGVYVKEYINGVSDGELIQIGQKGVVVHVVRGKQNELTTTSTKIGTTPVSISFDRADGSLNDEGDGVTYIKSFVISSGSKTITVTVDRLTGRIDLE